MLLTKWALVKFCANPCFNTAVLKFSVYWCFRDTFAFPFRLRKIVFVFPAAGKRSIFVTAKRPRFPILPFCCFWKFIYKQLFRFKIRIKIRPPRIGLSRHQSSLLGHSLKLHGSYVMFLSHLNKDDAWIWQDNVITILLPLPQLAEHEPFVVTV